VDADHIAAIDNVLRKMMQAGTRPLPLIYGFSLPFNYVLVGGAQSLVRH